MFWPPPALKSPLAYCYFTLAVAGTGMLALRAIVDSPFGYALRAIRENPRRARFIGVNVRRHQLLAFVLSGFFSGLAGGLSAFFNGSVFPDFAYLNKSFEPLVVVLLGGIYGTVRQLVGMMDNKGSPDLAGMSVVYCIFGAESGAAFLALLATPETYRIGEIDYNAVIIPSAPVPVGGSLLFVPATSVRPAGITVDAFMSIYVSMGVTGPQFLTGETQK